MQTIRKRISHPFLIIIILIPITILILFNVIVYAYSKAQAQEDLLDAVNEIATNLSQNNFELPNAPNQSLERPNLLFSGSNENLIKMGSLINNQSHSSSAELIVFNRNGELSKIFNDESFVTDEMADLLYAKTEEIPLGEIGSVRVGRDTIYVVEVDYQTQTMSDKVVYVSKGLVIDEFVTSVNIVLIFVSVVVTVVALFVSTRVANAIAKPIELLTAQVENMKSDEIVITQSKSDSLELQKLAAEINALNRRIYHHDQSQKSFLHNASHELRTPLMSIQGYADGIEMGIFDDVRSTAHLISEQSKRLTKLVDSLLSLARAENFSANKKLEKLNLGEQLLDLINRYNGYAVSNNIEIVADIADELFANSNGELLSGAVGNIISNAVRYAKTTVNISLKVRGKSAIITVRDDGNGIENTDKIFNRFAKGEDGNFGLGLCIAKTSTDMMNGEIKVYNDNGAVFEIILDLMQCRSSPL